MQFCFSSDDENIGKSFEFDLHQLVNKPTIKPVNQIPIPTGRHSRNQINSTILSRRNLCLSSKQECVCGGYSAGQAVLRKEIVRQ